MGKPTAEELNTALAEAQNMLDSDNDPDHVAHALLNIHERYVALEKVYEIADEFVRRGEDMEHGHVRLLRAFDEAREQEHHPTDSDILDHALAEAGSMREHDRDPHFIAKSLLNMNYCYHFMWRVWDAVEHYLRSGRDSLMQDKLKKAILEARQADNRTRGEETETYGLA